MNKRGSALIAVIMISSIIVVLTMHVITSSMYLQALSYQMLEAKRSQMAAEGVMRLGITYLKHHYHTIREHLVQADDYTITMNVPEGFTFKTPCHIHIAPDSQNLKLSATLTKMDERVLTISCLVTPKDNQFYITQWMIAA